MINPKNNKKDKRIFHALSTKDKDVALKKKKSWMKNIVEKVDLHLSKFQFLSFPLVY